VAAVQSIALLNINPAAIISRPAFFGDGGAGACLVLSFQSVVARSCFPCPRRCSRLPGAPARALLLSCARSVAAFSLISFSRGA